MLEDYLRVAHTLGAGGAYVVALDDVEQAGAHHAHEYAGGPQRQCKRWQQAVEEALPRVLVEPHEARRREQVELQREKIDKQYRSPESRQRKIGRAHV